MQLKKKFFFGIYKVEPSGEWFLELTQESLGVSYEYFQSHSWHHLYLETDISDYLSLMPLNVQLIQLSLVWTHALQVTQAFL